MTSGLLPFSGPTVPAVAVPAADLVERQREADAAELCDLAVQLLERAQQLQPRRLVLVLVLVPPPAGPR